MKIYNTMTRAKEEFVPLTPGEVRIYVCGVTVYDLCHIGHARSAIVFDVIQRYLRYKGYTVTFVKNFTDVDDKIILRAQALGILPLELAERNIVETRRDMAAIGIQAPDIEPKATDHIPQMIALIEPLIERGFAYAVDGDVYLEVRRFPAYGKLSKRELDEQLPGARVEIDERKRDPRDFALWKSAKPDEPSWPSPWGPGRPGWHIECSAMSMQYLGESFDIHGGGEDLIFPHHECEIAQSEAVTQKPFARYWIHNAFVNMGAEKMSKSLGNILTIRELIRRHDPEALRLYLLKTHYRNPVEWSEEHARAAKTDRESLRAIVAAGEASDPSGTRVFEACGGVNATEAAATRLVSQISDNLLRENVEQCVQGFQGAMDDDFNTPRALAALFALGDVLNNRRPIQGVEAAERDDFISGTEVLLVLARVLGLLERRGGYTFSVVLEGTMHVSGSVRLEKLPRELRQRIESLVEERDRMRTARDWRRADELRKELEELNVKVEDTPSGSRWTFIPTDQTE